MDQYEKSTRKYNEDIYITRFSLSLFDHMVIKQYTIYRKL